jgi:hypothetical protein
MMSKPPMRTGFALLLAALAAGACWRSAGIGEDSETEVDCSGALRFEDPSLEQAIREAIGKPDGDIYAADVAGLTDLEAGDLGIQSLQGIQCLTALTSLYVADGKITDLGPLSSLGALTWLGIARNPVSDLSPLSSLAALTQIDIQLTDVTDLSPIAALSALCDIKADSCEIADLGPLASLPCTEILHLNLTGNPITDLQPLVANPEIGAGDHVDMFGTLIEGVEQDDYLRALVDRGVCVFGLWIEPTNPDCPPHV